MALRVRFTLSKASTCLEKSPSSLCSNTCHLRQLTVLLLCRSMSSYQCCWLDKSQCYLYSPCFNLLAHVTLLYCAFSSYSKLMFGCETLKTHSESLGCSNYSSKSLDCSNIFSQLSGCSSESEVFSCRLTVASGLSSHSESEISSIGC